MTGPSHSLNLGSPGFTVGAPGPAPTARRRRASLDSSGLPPLPSAPSMGLTSAPSMGGTPFAICLDLVSEFNAAFIWVRFTMLQDTGKVNSFTMLFSLRFYVR